MYESVIVMLELPANSFMVLMSRLSRPGAIRTCADYAEIGMVQSILAWRRGGTHLGSRKSRIAATVREIWIGLNRRSTGRPMGIEWPAWFRKAGDEEFRHKARPRL